MEAPARKKIKVVFFDEAVAFGGSVVVLAHLFKHLDRQKIVPFLVTSLDHQSLNSLFKPEDVLHHLKLGFHYGNRVKWMQICPGRSHLAKKLWAYAFSGLSYVVDLPQYIALSWKLLRVRADLIHVNNGSEGPLASALFKIPMIWHLHGVSANFVRSRPRAKDPAATFICVSKFVSSQIIQQGVVSSRIYVVPNPAPEVDRRNANRRAWLSAIGIPEHAIVFSHVGRLVRWKGQFEFLQAFARMAAACPNAYALIVGDDAEGFSAEYPRSLQRLVDSNQLKDRVIFTGHISNVLEYMSYSDVVVHSSIEPEPFGLVITEAMAAGAAVIAARLGAPEEIIEHGTTGLLVDPTNIDEFAAALSALANNEQLRKEIAKAGTEMVSVRYSTQLFVDRISAIYEDTLGQLEV